MLSPIQPARSPFVLVGYLAASGIATLFGGYFTAKVTITTFYAALLKPLWAPPGWLFAPVWSVLYICMSLAMWLVWRNRPVPPSTGVMQKPVMDFCIMPCTAYTAAHACWWGQLVLNAAWPVVFGLQPAGLAAFVACAALGVAVVVCMVMFRRLSAPAALLMLPYAVWVSFATALSWALWRMNSAG